MSQNRRYSAHDRGTLAILPAVVRDRTPINFNGRDDNPVPCSPVSVLRENVIAALHYRVAGEPALRVVFLRRRV